MKESNSNQENQLRFKENKNRFFKGCLIGCLASILILLLIIGILIGAGYWFFTRVKQGKAPGDYFSIERSSSAIDCGDSLDCLEKNIVACEPSFGEADLENFIIFYFKILGKKEDFCVIYFRIKELKEVPSELESIPNFALKGLFENSSMECLVPKKYYQEGSKKAIDYALENMQSACKGGLLDLLDKLGY